MDTLNLHDLKHLAAIKHPGAVSLYLPTIGTGPEEGQDRVRFDELVQRADDILRPAGSLETPAPIAALHRLGKDGEFWKQRRHGVAAFVWGSELRAWRLPEKFVPRVVVATGFDLAPLIPVVDRGAWFHLLTLSQKHSHLFKVTQSRIESIDVPGFPECMEKALNIDETDRGAQVHEGARGGGGKQGAVFHGQGGVRESHKADLLHYFQLMDRALRPVLNGHHVPLVLGGVEYLIPLFREACSYPHVAREHLVGNFDRESTRELHDLSWALMTPTLDRARHEALERVAALAGTGRAAAEVSQVVVGAVQGRVQTLLVDPTQSLWGELDAATNRVTVETGAVPGSVDLLNLAVVETLLHGGDVYAAAQSQLPDQNCLAAVFRY